MNPLERYIKLSEENGIGEETNVSPIGQLGFAREQSNQMKQIINRLLFDLTMAYTKLDGAKDLETKAALKQKIGEYERDLRQTRDALVVANSLVEELESTVNEG